MKLLAPVAVATFTASAFATAVIGLSADERPRAVEPARAQQRPVTAVAFLRQTIRQLAANQYAAAWTTLDPRQQRRVSREAYARCEGASPIPGAVARVEARDVRIERVRVPGAGARRSRSIAVTFSVTFAPLPSNAPVVVRVRAHALRTQGRWAWMLPAQRFALHVSGRCGLSPQIVGPNL